MHPSPLVLLFALVGFAAAQAPTVTLPKLGQITGSIVGMQYGTKQIARFLGIPFAVAPVETLRFRPPQPYTTFNPNLNALSYQAVCYQEPVASFLVGEDCLFLNVWVPNLNLPPSAGGGLLPVLVWFHDGSFLGGGASIPNSLFQIAVTGEELSGAGMGAVVVTFNYRVGVFGWGVFDADTGTTSNLGLLDQQMALTWIQSNIAQFGGDPKRVTLFGHGSGSISVSLHLLIASSQALFARAALSSGTAYQGINGPLLKSAYNIDDRRKTTQNIFSACGCTQVNAAEQLACAQLPTLSALNLYACQSALVSASPAPDDVFLPVLDALLPADPMMLLYTRAMTRTKAILVGSVSDEGTTFIPDALVNSTMARVTAFTTALFGQENANTLSRSQSYQPDPVDLTAPEYVAAAYAGDFFFNCPQRRLLAAAERTSASAPALYQFLWAHRPSWLEPERLRIAHGSEIAFLFGVQPRTSLALTDAEKQLAAEFRSAYVEFATSGRIANWAAWDGQDQKYTFLATNGSSQTNIETRAKYRSAQCSLWDAITPFDSSFDTEVAYTTSGLIRGRKLPPDPVNVREYLGIPFAAPPVGSLRFKLPVDSPEWRPRVRDALANPSPCLQSTKIPYIPADWFGSGSEDCLALNIWAPVQTPVCTLLPVIVWIHGGGFAAGGIGLNGYRGDRIAASGQVLVVSIQYRLGVFGWGVFVDSSTSSPSYVSNIGLLDQQAALRWVRDNIASFGGDPNAITLFGNGAGSYSISLHLLIATSQTLFAQAILASGTTFQGADGPSLSPPYNLGTVKSLTDSVLAKVNCSTLECARALDPRVLLGAQADITDFTPVIDGVLILDDPLTLLYSGNVNLTHAIMIGDVADEGTMFVPDIDHFTDAQLQQTLEARFEGDAVSKILNFYPLQPDEPSLSTPGYRMASITGDYGANCPSRRLVTALSSLRGATDRFYMYSMVHQPSWANTSLRVSHFSETWFVFGHPPMASIKFTEFEETLSLNIRSAWIAFAAFSDAIGFWAKWEPVFKPYLEFGSPNADTPFKKDWKGPQCNFWDLITPNPTVKTKLPLLNGLVQGQLNTDSSVITEFLGIPYAVSPQGDMRFAPPIRREPWSPDVPVLQAISFQKACMQTSSAAHQPGTVDEDCLAINVWTKTGASLVPDQRLPVLVWLHGGEFVQGGANEYAFRGDILAASGDVVVVTFQYRLGIFGWGVLDDDAGPGLSNSGLLDQRMALQWVQATLFITLPSLSLPYVSLHPQDNIAAFAGDRNNVTIFGQGAGSVSASLHLVLKESNQLFRSAILQSGAAFQGMYGPSVVPPFSITAQRNATLTVMSAAGCANVFKRVVNMTCARALTPDALIQAQSVTGVSFGPVFDDVVIQSDPLMLLEDPLITQYPRRSVMIGGVADEGTYLLPNIRNTSFASVRANVQRFFGPRYEAEILNTYFSGAAAAGGDGYAAAALWGDYLITCPMRRAMKTFEQSSRNFRMFSWEFLHQPSWVNCDAGSQFCDQVPLRVAHGSETYFVFGRPPLPSLQFSAQEAVLSARMRAVWIEFATNGVIASWPRWNSGGQGYVPLDVGGAFLPNVRWRSEFCDFWDSITGHPPTRPPVPPRSQWGFGAKAMVATVTTAFAILTPILTLAYLRRRDMLAKRIGLEMPLLSTSETATTLSGGVDVLQDATVTV